MTVKTQRVWNNSTATGVSDWAYFGTGKRFVSSYVTSTSTEVFNYSVEVSVGFSTHQVIVLAAADSTGDTSRTSTGGVVFDKARINVVSNATTGDAIQVWLVASP